jgi:hypothetical protein
MNRGYYQIILFILIAFPVLFPESSWSLNFQSLNLSIEGRIKDLRVEDLNYDGLKDLLVVHIKGLSPRESRWLSIFWQKPDGSFNLTPDQSWEVDQQATVLDIGEISDQFAGQELLFLTKQGVSFYPLINNKYSEKPISLISHPAFTTCPEVDNLPITNFVQDWNQDGQEDIAIIDFGKLIIFFGDGKGSFSQKNEIKMDIEPFYLGYDPLDKSNDPTKIPRFTATYFFPELNLRDYNGDGRKDLIAVQRDVLYWYRHNEEDKFEPLYIKKDLDIRTEKEKKGEMVNLKMMVEDLNGDGLVDVLINKQKARGLTSLFSLVSIFYNKKGQGIPSVPDQIIITEGTASVSMVIRDLNHDGRKDIILPSFQFGLGAIIRYFFTKKIKVSFLVYLMGKEGHYPDKPNLKKNIKFKIDFSGQSNLAVIDPDGDYNGDGINDLVFGTDEDELSIFPGVKGTSRHKKIYHDKPMVQLRVNTLGYLVTSDLNRKGRSDLILYYPREPKLWNRIVVFLNK